MAMDAVLGWTQEQHEQVDIEEYTQRRCQHDQQTKAIVGPRTAGALGIQMAGTGVHWLERRPAWPALGFDPNLPAQRWRVVGPWFETRGGHAPEGATFEGRHDPAVYLGESHQGP